MNNDKEIISTNSNDQHLINNSLSENIQNSNSFLKSSDSEKSSNDDSITIEENSQIFEEEEEEEEEDIIKKTNKNKEMELSDFFNQHRQYFIMTEGGTPIYSRYSDEMKICGILATFSAIITKFTIFNKYKDNIEKLNYICNNKSIIVFLKVGSLFLIAISQQNDSISFLYSQLELLYIQLLSIITKPGICKLEEKPSSFNFILEKNIFLFEQIIQYSSHSLSSLIKCFQVSPIENRYKIYDIISKNKIDYVLFCIFDKNANQLISLIKSSYIKIVYSDIVLIQNFIMLKNLEKKFEVFENLCLPGISDQGPLQIYSNFTFDDIGFVFICESDEEKIKNKYQSLSKKIYNEIISTKLLMNYIKKPINIFEKEDDELDNFKIKSLFIQLNKRNKISKSLEPGQLKKNQNNLINHQKSKDDSGLNIGIKKEKETNFLITRQSTIIDISGFSFLNLNSVNTKYLSLSYVKYSIIINHILNQFFTINLSSYNKIIPEEKYINKVYTKLYDLYKCKDKNDKSNFLHFEKDNNYNHIIYVYNSIIIIATFNIFKTYNEIINNVKSIYKLVSGNENEFFVQIK